jgi:hypothetical protein
MRTFTMICEPEVTSVPGAEALQRVGRWQRQRGVSGVLPNYLALVKC